jgi:hypothetical protein
LVEPTARGDPEAPLRWTCKSLRRLADELQAQGHRVTGLSHLSFAELGEEACKESLAQGGAKELTFQ